MIKTSLGENSLCYLVRLVEEQIIRSLFPLITVVLCASCGSGDYSENSSERKTTENDSRPDVDNNGDAIPEHTPNKNSGTPGEGTDNHPEASGTEMPEAGNTDSTSSVSWQDALGKILAGNNTTSPSTPGSTTAPTQTSNPSKPAPEPSSDDCIGTDEFICAIEVAITFHTNNLRSASSPLQHHAKLSYVSRNWSATQAQQRRIGHTGFPAARNTDYIDSFPGESITIRAENVAYSSTSSDKPETIALIFVNMWKNSAGHRRNMLGNYHLLGSGVSRVNNTFYATQIFAVK